MTQLSIKMTPDAALVRQGLQDLGAEIKKIGRLQIYRTEQAIVRRMKRYWTDNDPPQLPPPSPLRTGTLAGGYDIVSLPDGYQIKNDVPYTPYVVGDAYGTGQRQHPSWLRHKRLRVVSDEEIAKLPREIDDAIQVVARRF